MSGAKIEEMPTKLGVAIFKILFKRKGSPDDPTNRCIGLLNSSYKVLSAAMLHHLMKETTDYLQDWQAGFRQKRGYRDNVLILHTLVDKILQEGKPLVFTFIDYSSAFDSVAHKFLDKTLGQTRPNPRPERSFVQSIVALRQ